MAPRSRGAMVADGRFGVNDESARRVSALDTETQGMMPDGFSERERTENGERERAGEGERTDRVSPWISGSLAPLDVG